MLVKGMDNIRSAGVRDMAVFTGLDFWNDPRRWEDVQKTNLRDGAIPFWMIERKPLVKYTAPTVVGEIWPSRLLPIYVSKIDGLWVLHDGAGLELARSSVKSQLYDLAKERDRDLICEA